MVNVIYIHYRHHHWYHFCCHYFRFSPTAITDLDEGDQSAGATCTLLGFSEYPDLQVPLFLVFTVYTVTVTGPLGMIAIIRVSPNLQTPVYYFLSHCPLLTSVIAPQLHPNSSRTWL